MLLAEPAEPKIDVVDAAVNTFPQFNRRRNNVFEFTPKAL
jgi:hypothetical protein